jgi:2-(1,2-epoxy-1,2-dihydrophenyl)acetyl-CoA isomerase
MSAVLTEDRGYVRIVTLNRPERRNALDMGDRVALLDVLKTTPATTRALVLSGGDFFCAGGDIRTMTQDLDVARERLEVINDVVRVIITGDLPVVAAVEGGAIGLGFGLALACDFVVAGRSSTFAASFAKIGLGPDTGLSYSLPLRVGQARTRELLMTARKVPAPEAVAMGAIDEVVDDGQALTAALERADQLATLSSPMVAAVRRLLIQPDRSIEAMLATEQDVQLELFATAEFREGQDAFRERRSPDFIDSSSSNGQDTP